MAAWKNTLKTTALLGGIGGLLVLVGSLLGGAGGALIGLVLGVAIVGFTYWCSDRLAIRAAGAHEVTDQEEHDLLETVRSLADRAEIPMPRVYVSPSPQPNAFASGRSPKKAVVCVTEGLLSSSPPAELRGVLAHEIGHIANRDILIGSVAAAIATGISFVANMALWAGMFGGDGEDGPPLPVLLVTALLAPIAASILQMTLSRSREFEADRAAAELTGDPEALAQALLRLEATARRVPVEVSQAQASAYIVNPLTGRQMRFAALFQTHPATEERVARLRAFTRSAAMT